MGNCLCATLSSARDLGGVPHDTPRVIHPSPYLTAMPEMLCNISGTCHAKNVGPRAHARRCETHCTYPLIFALQVPEDMALDLHDLTRHVSEMYQVVGTRQVQPICGTLGTSDVLHIHNVNDSLVHLVQTVRDSFFLCLGLG